MSQDHSSVYLFEKERTLISPQSAAAATDSETVLLGQVAVRVVGTFENDAMTIAIIYSLSWRSKPI